MFERTILELEVRKRLNASKFSAEPFVARIPPRTTMGTDIFEIIICKKQKATDYTTYQPFAKAPELYMRV